MSSSLFRLPLLLALWLLMVPAAWAQLLLTPGAGVVQAWPQARLLSQAPATLDLAGAMAVRSQFEPVNPARATLGLQPDPVWLYLPLQADAGSVGRWVLDIDYPALNRVDVFLTRDGELLQATTLGSHQPFAQRPLGGRSLAVPLNLAPGVEHELWLRVHSAGALILPLTLSEPAAHQRQALGEQMLQGLLTGLALSLLAYSLMQWLTLRDVLFLKYLLMTAGSLWFSIFHFGLGQQFLWTDNFWLERHAAGFSSFMALCGSFLFIEHALRGPDGGSRRLRWVMQGGAVLAALLALAHALDAISGPQVAAIVSLLGPVPALMGLPGALRRALRGDPIGATFLLAWLIYFVATAVLIGVIQGALPVNFWTLHAFQFGATLDMLLFMRVLSLRARAVQEAAQHATRERDDLRSLAQTDPLTGLPNRRALHAALHDALHQSSPTRLVAVYALDLDGFKPVNDRHGHDVGDALLAAVAQRLRAQTRHSDLLARVGGDEFVLMAPGLADEAAAQELGHKLLHALETPFDVAGLPLQVGLTAGYALAPIDGTDGTQLLRLADAAMYQGKQAGKQRLCRHVPA